MSAEVERVLSGRIHTNTVRACARRRPQKPSVPDFLDQDGEGKFRQGAAFAPCCKILVVANVLLLRLPTSIRAREAVAFMLPNGRNKTNAGKGKMCY